MDQNTELKKLFEAGAHFGHKTSRWHPKMAPYIHSVKNGSHVIDLAKTIALLEPALSFLSKTASEGKQILIVGTKRQAQDLIVKLAEDTDMPYVSERWLGGLLTNYLTINEQVKHLKDLELKMSSGQLAAKYSKLEVQHYQEEIDALNHIYGGIKKLNGKPGALFIIDINHEANAVKEATKLHVPTVAMVDTNTNPTLINYPIPANDDSIKTIELITKYVATAINEGKAKKIKEPEAKLELQASAK